MKVITILSRHSSKSTVAKTAKTKVHHNLDDQPLELLSKEEFEAITAANYEHPESRIILRLFLQVNYFWHISRIMQELPSAVTSVDWKRVEDNSAQTIRKTFQ